MSKNPFPTRMCSGCMKRKPKSELIRIVRCASGKAIIDSEYKLSGRGAYVCPDKDCILSNKKRNRFAKALKGEVDSVIYDELTKLVSKE